MPTLAPVQPPIPNPFPPMHVYAMRMYNERLQILVSKEQKLLLEQEAKRRGASVASIIREAVDDRLGAVASEDRTAAVSRIAAIQGAPFLPPEEMERAIAAANEAEFGFPPKGAPR